MRFNNPEYKIVKPEQAIIKVREWQRDDLVVVMADSVVDIPHYRHAEFFRTCANMGDKFVLRVNSDDFVAQRKDPRGPIVRWKNRVKHVVHYPYIDLVTSKDEGGWNWLDDYHPNIVVKSTTSGNEVTREIAELSKRVDLLPVKLVVLDQFCNPVENKDVEAEGRRYFTNKFTADKFSGSVIKREIIKRFEEDHK